MRRLLNTLYVSTEGAYVRKDGENAVVEIDGQEKLRAPLHLLGGVICFGRANMSPALMGANFTDNPILASITPVKEIFENPSLIPVYPNPIAGGALNFGRQVQAYGIFDANGNLVKYGLDTDHVLIEGLPGGVYFIQLDGQAQKFIVR